MHKRAVIDRYLDAGCSPAAEERLRAHLRECDACRAYYDEQVLLRRALSGGLAAPTPAEQQRVAQRALRAAAPLPTHRMDLSRVADFVIFEPRRTAWVAAVAVLAVVVGLVVVPAPRAAVIVRGADVTVNGKPVTEARVLRGGDTVRVAPQGVAVLELERGGTVRMYPDTTVQVHRRGHRLTLPAGRVWCLIDKGKGTFVVHTPTTKATVLGTSFVVDHDTSQGTTEVRVMEGRVRVADRTREGQVEVEGGYKTRVREGTKPSPPEKYDPKKDKFDWEKFFEALRESIKKFIRSIEDAFK